MFEDISGSIILGVLYAGVAVGDGALVAEDLLLAVLLLVAAEEPAVLLFEDELLPDVLLRDEELPDVPLLERAVDEEPDDEAAGLDVALGAAVALDGEEAPGDDAADGLADDLGDGSESLPSSKYSSSPLELGFAVALAFAIAALSEKS